MFGTSKKVLLSGIKPTGTIHIGNYFGAMQQFVELQNEYQSYVFIADLHALTSLQNPAELNENIIQTVAAYLAVGLDPKLVTIYKQSDVPEVAELAWIFNCLTTVPYLMRAHAYKDAEAKNKEVNVGVFDYPILMAADILIQSPDIVPVGADQKQHIEITRDTAQKFNHTYGETFKLPAPVILELVKTIVGTDGRKMSKSYGNTISLFAEDDEIASKVMSIPTDSKSIDEPKNMENDNLFSLHRLFSLNDLEDLERRYREGGIGYRESKEILARNMKAFITPLREKRNALLKDRKHLLNILKEGGEKARERAVKKMTEIRKKIGVTLY